MRPQGAEGAILQLKKPVHTQRLARAQFARLHTVVFTKFKLGSNTVSFITFRLGRILSATQHEVDR